MTRARTRRRALRIVPIVLLVCVLVAGAPLAGAHATLSESDPGNGERVDELPETVTLTFSGDGVQLAEVEVRDGGGTDVSGEAAIDPDDAQRVLVPIERTDEGDVEGVYTVEWEVLADDGHTTAGTFLFTVGDEPLDRDRVIELHEDEEEDVSPVEAAANGLVLLSLVGLVGVPVTLWIAIYPLAGRFDLPLDRAERRARSVLALSAALSLAGVAALGLARSASLAPSLSIDAVGRFLGTSLGALWLAQLAVAGAILATLLVARRRSIPRRYWLGGAIVAGLVVQLSVSATSHSASLIDRLQGTAADFAHVGGAALWVGGLLVLGLVLPVVLRDREARDGRRIAAAAVGRFSIVALTGVTLALATGLVLAAWHAPDPATLGTTRYGQALSAKTLLVLAALGIGGLVRTVLLRRLRRGEADAGSVVRAVRVETGVLLVVVLVSGLITATPTAAIAADREPSEVTVREGDIELAVLPAEAGGGGTVLVDEGEPVVIDAAFLDGDERVTVEDPTLLMRNDHAGVTLTAELEESEEGLYSTVQVLPDVGAWDVRVSGQVGESFESEWFRLFVVPDHPAHDEHDHGADTAFAAWLRAGALGVGAAGTLAVLLETVRFGRAEP